MFAIILAGAPAIFAGVLTNREKETLPLVAIASLSVNAISIFYCLQFSYLPGRDILFFHQILDLIGQTSHIPLGLGVYQAWVNSYYPFFFLLLSNFRFIAGLDITSTLVSFCLLSTFFPFLIFLIAKKVFNSYKIAVIAAIIYIYIPGSYAGSGYRFLGLVFFYLFFISLLSFQDTKKHTHFVLSLIFVFALSATHHITLYIALLFITFLYIANSIHFKGILKQLSHFRATNYKLSVKHLLLFLIVGLVWPLFFAFPVTAVQTAQFKYIFFSGNEPTSSLSLTSSIISIGEIIFTVTTIFCFLLTSLIGAYVYLTKETWDKRFVAFSIFFISLFALGFLGRNLHPDVANLWWRSWETLFASAGPFFAYLIVKHSKKESIPKLKRIKSCSKLEILTITILLCLIATYMLMIPREYLDFNFENKRGILVNYRYGGDELYHGSIWFSRYTDNTYIAVCDQPLYDFIKGYFRGNLTYNWDLYSDISQLSTKLQALENQGVRYIFINQLMSKYDESPTYMTYVSRVPSENLLEIESTLPEIYDNGVVQICTIGFDSTP